jgi:ketosteroid isomerase-like protein
VTSRSAIDELADRFIAAIASGDMETVRSIYSADAQIWHNFDDVTQTREQNLRQVGWFSTRLTNMRYEDIRRIVLDDGFVQQHVLRGGAPNGQPINIHAMLRVWCDDTTITRLEEYLDPAQAAAITQ